MVNYNGNQIKTLLNTKIMKARTPGFSKVPRKKEQACINDNLSTVRRHKQTINYCGKH